MSEQKQDTSVENQLNSELETAQTENESQVEDTAADNASVDVALEQALARVQELEQELQTQQAEFTKKEQDSALRTRAEIENIRRRAEQDVEKAHKFGLEKFAKELLNVVDNLERGLENLVDVDESVKPLIEGVELTQKSLIDTLVKFGVEAVGVVGEAFNPELHQAISMQPAEGIETNHLSVVLQKGYTLHGRVIRPAMVMVAA